MKSGGRIILLSFINGLKLFAIGSSLILVASQFRMPLNNSKVAIHNRLFVLVSLSFFAVDTMEIYDNPVEGSRNLLFPFNMGKGRY